MESPRRKTRDLSVAEYFLQIQREYLIADFRRKIYSSRKDKAYWNRVIKYKEKRINDIAERNNLFSILNNVDTYNEVRNELFEKNGMPKFPMSEDDVMNYYSPNNNFSYDRRVWTLKRIEEGDRAVIFQKEPYKEIQVNKSEIFRIL